MCVCRLLSQGDNMSRTRTISCIGLGVLAALLLAVWLEQRRIDRAVAELNSNDVTCSFSRRRDAYIIGGVAIDNAGILTPRDSASPAMVLSDAAGGIIVSDADGIERRYVGMFREGQIIFVETPYSDIVSKEQE